MEFGQILNCIDWEKRVPSSTTPLAWTRKEHAQQHILCAKKWLIRIKPLTTRYNFFFLAENDCYYCPKEEVVSKILLTFLLTKELWKNTVFENVILGYFGEASLTFPLNGSFYNQWKFRSMWNRAIKKRVICILRLLLSSYIQMFWSVEFLLPSTNHKLVDDDHHLNGHKKSVGTI